MGGAEYHNKPFHYAELAGILAGEAKADVRITDDLAVLNPAELAQYRVIANWSTFVQPNSDQVQALLDAIAGGAGFLSLHGGAATFWNSAPYLTMLGSRFVRHDPFKQFMVSIDDREHPITLGINDFTVEDELYELGGKVAEFAALAAGVTTGRSNSELRALGDGPLSPDVHVLASAEGHPLLYVKTYGRGRVHYNALGHDTQALQNPSYRRLLAQGLAWVADQPTPGLSPPLTP